MLLAEISPFIRFANEIIIPKRKTDMFCADCRLVFILEGEGKIRINGKYFTFKAGTLLMWQAKTLYRFIFQSSVKGIAIDFDFISNGQNQKEIFPLLPVDQFELYQHITISDFSDTMVLNSPIVIDNAFFLQDRICQIVNEFKKQTPFSVTNASAYLKLCISKISKSIMLSKTDPEIIKKIEFIADYIQKNYTNELSNSSLAILVGYHPYYLNRIFKLCKGCPIHQYIINHRLSIAVDLLLSTDYGISEIAQKSGFNSQISFIRAFKKQYHLTPTEFLKKTL